MFDNQTLFLYNNLQRYSRNKRGDDLMDRGVIENLITRFRPISLFIDKSENIIWLSNSLKDILHIDTVRDLKLEDIFQIDLKSIKASDNRVVIDGKSFKVSEISTDYEDLIILTLELIGDYDDCEVKVFSYEKIIDDLYDGVLLTDKKGKVILYNKAMEELEERNSDEMIGKNIWDAYGYNDKSKSEHMRVYESGVAIIDKYKAHAYNNGKPIYKSYSTMPIEKDGEIIGVYSISKNETKLQSLLSEIVELKRQFNDRESKEHKSNNNGTRYTFADIIGSSTPIKKLIEEAQAISWLDNSVLLVGDTGTGKEVFAQSIHNFGKRKSEPFIGINCSAIPENLLESILFGSVKGAYTGALDSSGLFEEAGHGTLFLDELNSMPTNMQTKLLRVLQEKSVRRVGGKQNYPINCRVISAMNEDPYQLIEEGNLRQDLFYRIAGYNLYIPKLIERGNDLFGLSEHYISKYNILMNKNVADISDELKQMMLSHSWPGNIRELEHFIENIMVRTAEDDRTLRIENIPDYIMDVMDDPQEAYPATNEENQTLQDRLDIMERKMILEELDKNMWNVSRTAVKLGITRQSLIYRMRKMEIERQYTR